MFLNASSKLNLGFKTPAFFVAIFMASVLVAFSSCSKDDPNVITNDVTGEYSGFNAFLGFGTGNIDMKITSVGSDEIELQFLTDYHHDTGTYFKLSQDVFNLKLTKGANGRISLTMPAKMMTVIEKGTNAIKGATVEASGTFMPNPSGESSGSTLLLSFSIVGVFDGSQNLVYATYAKQ